LKVHVSLYYTASGSGSHLLNVFLLENHILTTHADYTNGTQYNYDNKHVLRQLITGQWGDAVTSTSQDERFFNTYTYTVPNDFVIDNCELAVFVTDADHYEVHQGIHVPVTCSNPVAFTVNVSHASSSSATDGGAQVNITSSGNYETYWDLTTPQTGNTLSNVGPGTYTVTVIDQTTGCAKSEDVTVAVSTGMASEAAAGALQVYPNPFTETAIVRFEHPANGAYQLEILDPHRQSGAALR